MDDQPHAKARPEFPAPDLDFADDPSVGRCRRHKMDRATASRRPGTGLDRRIAHSAALSCPAWSTAGRVMNPRRLQQTDDLPNLAARINETHGQAMRHAGLAIGFAIACGELLLKAKATVPHGQWLPWLRVNCSFGERSAQGYMRIAQRLPNAQRVADMPLRRVLGELRTPLLARRMPFGAEIETWLDRTVVLKSKRPADVKDWTIEDAQACIANIRNLDQIMHRYGICPEVGDPEPSCLVCIAAQDARGE